MSPSSQTNYSNEHEARIPILEDWKENETTSKNLLEEATKHRGTNWVVLLWMLINLLATVGIVFTNKAIFTDKTLVKMPVTFTAFHFFCTFCTLFVMQLVGKFTPKSIRVIEILPLCLLFCGNVLLPNMSLAYSSVSFYQLIRILVTPATALLNWLFYNTLINRGQLMSLIPICGGIAMTTVFDLKGGGSEKSTSVYGVICGSAGVMVSAMYVIWIGVYFKRHNCSSLQLLYNQAPVSVILLSIVIPFTDTIPNFSDVSSEAKRLVLVSGMFAILINMSQFYIVQGTNALTSTVVGHMKTCSILALGWAFGAPMHIMAALGTIVAVGGIMQYTAASRRK
jgi:solute carrier family 35 protein E3